MKRLRSVLLIIGVLTPFVLAFLTQDNGSWADKLSVPSRRFPYDPVAIFSVLCVGYFFFTAPRVKDWPVLSQPGIWKRWLLPFIQTVGITGAVVYFAFLVGFARNFSF